MVNGTHILPNIEIIGFFSDFSHGLIQRGPGSQGDVQHLPGDEGNHQSSQ